MLQFRRAKGVAGNTAREAGEVLGSGHEGSGATEWSLITFAH